MTARRYLDAISDKLAELGQEAPVIQQAAELCAETIARGGVVHVFGAGHSRMMAEEAYPRIGAVVGFHPIVELAVTYFHTINGPNGLRQALFLERVPGYGRVIFGECGSRPGDATIVFSSSGVEHIIMDYVAAAQAAQVKVIGVTSKAYSSVASAERSDAPRLYDVADIAIDNHVPVGDALIDCDGLDQRVGASASILNLAVMDAITAGTAQGLLDRGVEPLVFSSPHLAGAANSEARMTQCLEEYDRRVTQRS